MATIDQTSLGELLKNVYAPWDIEELNNLTHPLLGEIAPTGSASLGGTGFFFPVRAESAEGHAYIDETQDFANLGRQSAVLQAQVDPTVQVGVVQLSGLSQSLSRGNAAAFAQAFDENVQQTLSSMSAYNEGVLFRSGNGILASIDVDPGAVAAGTLWGNNSLDDVGYLREGMYIDIVDADGVTHHNGGARITQVDWVNETIAIDQALDAAVTTGDDIYITGSQQAGTAVSDKEPIGLARSIGDTTTEYLSIARSGANRWSNWIPLVQTESGFLDEEIVLRARTRITQESGIPFTAMSSFAGVCHPQQTDVLFKLGIPRIRYAGGETIDLGNSANVVFGGMMFKTSYQCPTSLLYIGDWSKHNTLYAPGGELHIDTEYNGSAMKWVASKDVGLVFAKCYKALALRNPTCFIQINTLSTPTR
jgi:hypothetical protein